ncbi:MAG: hypothetical protein RLZZ157_1506 [Pseudomonadota bacterium]|jgi:predicted DCC family thiol-disulfide oxidoreductase YuxK
MTCTAIPELTIWYDGGCPLCVAEIAFIQHLDAKAGKITFVDVSDEQAGASCPLDRANLLARFHAQEVGQPIVSGIAAFGAMWRRVTPLQPLGWIASFKPLEPFLNALYAQFLRVRPRLQIWMRARRKAQS